MLDLPKSQLLIKEKSLNLKKNEQKELLEGGKEGSKGRGKERKREERGEN